MTDPKKIATLIDRIRKHVLRLRELQNMNKGEFLRQDLMMESARLNLQYALEACLDLTNHVIARFGLRSPQDYADSFAVLAENGIVPQDLLVRLKAMARMRNRLVHLYWETDDGAVYTVIHDHLGDFDLFARSVLDAIAARKKAPRQG